MKKLTDILKSHVNRKRSVGWLEILALWKSHPFQVLLWTRIPAGLCTAPGGWWSCSFIVKGLAALGLEPAPMAATSCRDVPSSRVCLYLRVCRSGLVSGALQKFNTPLTCHHHCPRGCQPGFKKLSANVWINSVHVIKQEAPSARKYQEKDRHRNSTGDVGCSRGQHATVASEEEVRTDNITAASPN